MCVIPRPHSVGKVKGLLSRHPVVAIVGARQVGKTTLARQVALEESGPTHFYDLEDPTDRARLTEPMLALKDREGLVVLDEIQHQPDLFPILRVLADRQESAARFLVLGSASPLLLRQGAESLAGRLAVYELGGFDLDEVGRGAVSRRWLRGGFPRSFLAEAEAHSVEWRREFIETFLGRDLPQLGITVAPMTLRRFWTMLAHAHGQVANLSQLGRSLGVADTTVRRYLDILVSTFVVRQLLPWWENLKKRQVKAPKIYLSDSGLLHTLLGIETPDELEGHPKLGASFEGFALEMITRAHALRPEECFFWATHAGAEIDLLVVRGDRRIGFEFKRTAAPKVSRSMRVALSDLRLQRLMVVHAGTTSFPLAPKIDAIPLADVGDLDLGLR